jgi:hypothetical protein
MLTIPWTSLQFLANAYYSFQIVAPPYKSLQFLPNPYYCLQCLPTMLFFTNPYCSLQILAIPCKKLTTPSKYLLFLANPYYSLQILSIPYYSLQIHAIPYKYLLLVIDPYHSLQIIANPCYSLHILVNPYKSIHILTNPYLSLQILPLPYNSLPVLMDPYKSLQCHTIPYSSLQILTVPYESLLFRTHPLQFLPNHQYERFCHSVHDTKGSAQATAWASSGVEPTGFDCVFLGKMVVNHVLLAMLHRCIFNIPKEDDENYPSQLGLRWVVFLSCRSFSLFSLIKAYLQGFLPSSKNWFLSAASAEGSSALFGVDYIKKRVFKAEHSIRNICAYWNSLH